MRKIRLSPDSEYKKIDRRSSAFIGGEK